MFHAIQYLEHRIVWLTAYAAYVIKGYRRENCAIEADAAVESYRRGFDTKK